MKTDEIFHNRTGDKPLELNGGFLVKPLWINGRTADTFRFLIQWLVVSLVEIPLMILQIQKPNGPTERGAKMRVQKLPFAGLPRGKKECSKHPQRTGK